MSECVLDSSTLLAVLLGESGTDDILDDVAGAFISTVNLAEVYSKSRDIGLTMEELTWAVSQLRVRSVVLDDPQALIIGTLRERTRHRGLSLGDRACLALSYVKKLPALTADSDWLDCDLEIEVRLIRERQSK